MRSTSEHHFDPLDSFIIERQDESIPFGGFEIDQVVPMTSRELTLGSLPRGTYRVYLSSASAVPFVFRVEGIDDFDCYRL
jgi:hypothetical protein